MRLFLLIVFIFCSCCTFSQINHPQYVEDTSDIYYWTLALHLSALDSARWFRWDSTAEIFIEDEWFIEKLPLQIGMHKLTYLDWSAASAKAKKEKSYGLLRVFPAKVRGDSITVGMVWFGVSRKKSVFLMSHGDEFHAYFRFNCEKKYFEIYRSSLTGI